MALNLEYYTKENEKEWDEFVLNKSINGTFLQTRNFINYHQAGKFEDCSLCIRKGHELVATIMACIDFEDDKKTFFAHKGSTFGGICISKNIYNANAINELLEILQEFWQKESFEKVYIKLPPAIYQKYNTDLLDYFLYKYDFFCYNELNYYMHLNRYQEDILKQFSSSKRRDYRYSLKNELEFKELKTKEEIALFYDVLQLNLKKLNLSSVHTLEELYDLKFCRFDKEIAFYGVFQSKAMIAGSMTFTFDNRIFHTQYLSSNEQYLKLFPMDFLIYNLIQTAIDKKMEIFSFGICTENRGKYLNLGLSRFKEGFGTEFCINRSYEKNISLS